MSKSNMDHGEEERQTKRGAKGRNGLEEWGEVVKGHLGERLWLAGFQTEFICTVGGQGRSLSGWVISCMGMVRW